MADIALNFRLRSSSLTSGDDKRISRHALEYLVDSTQHTIAFLGEQFLVDLPILLSVWNANSRWLHTDAEQFCHYCFEADQMPLDKKRGISRNGLSAFLDIPFETVRRRAEKLIERGILISRPDGLVCASIGKAFTTDFRDIEQFNADLVAKLYGRLLADGYERNLPDWVIVQTGAEFPRARPQWVRALTRASVEYLASIFSHMARALGLNFLQTMIVLTILKRNIEHLIATPDHYSDIKVSPDSVRRGIARKDVAQALRIPPETARRHISSLIAQGFLIERKDGLVTPEAVIARLDGLRQSNVRLVAAMLNMLEELERYIRDQSGHRHAC